MREREPEDEVKWERERGGRGGEGEGGRNKGDFACNDPGGAFTPSKLLHSGVRCM